MTKWNYQCVQKQERAETRKPRQEIGVCKVWNCSEDVSDSRCASLHAKNPRTFTGSWFIFWHFDFTHFSNQHVDRVTFSLCTIGKIISQGTNLETQMVFFFTHELFVLFNNNWFMMVTSIWFDLLPLNSSLSPCCSNLLLKSITSIKSAQYI